MLFLCGVGVTTGEARFGMGLVLGSCYLSIYYVPLVERLILIVSVLGFSDCYNNKLVLRLPTLH
jgi:hypothetical protein